MSSFLPILHTRAAVPSDAAAITHIFSHMIEDRSSTFETGTPTEKDVERWFNDVYPIVVVEAEGEVIAFACTASHSLYGRRYPGIASISVYVAREARGLGARPWRAAIQALIWAAERAGFYKLLCFIFSEGKGFIAILRSYGFRQVGYYEKHDQLEGVWKNLVIVERLIPANLELRDNPPAVPHGE